MEVYNSILAVINDFGSSPIQKKHVNSFQRYQFRGIEDVLMALNPLLVNHNLVILPRVTARETIIGQTKNDGVSLNTRLMVDFDIVSTKDQSKHTVSVVGEASDTSDKSHNKAMSCAYKYMAFMTFCIPTQGVHNDTEEDSPETAAELKAQQKKEAKSEKVEPKKEDPLRAAYLDFLQKIKEDHKVVLTSAMVVTLCERETGSKEPADLVKYLASLDERLPSNALTENERKLLNIKEGDHA